MSKIALPARMPLNKASWTSELPVQVNRSGWTNRKKSVGLPGAEMWKVKASFAPVRTVRDALRWKSFFMRLKGPFNSFPVIAVEAVQTSAPNPAVAAGTVTDNTLLLKGLPVSSTVLIEGMAMTVPLPSGHERLVILTRDLVSDASGNAVAQFEPDLLEAPFADVTVEISEPWALMCLPTGTRGWDVEARLKYGFAFEAEEAL